MNNKIAHIAVLILKMSVIGVKFWVTALGYHICMVLTRESLWVKFQKKHTDTRGNKNEK